jgi:hypothetical protein
MLSTIALILIVLWLLGMVSSYTMGGFIHILLVVAVVVFLVRVIQGRRPVVYGRAASNGPSVGAARVTAGTGWWGVQALTRSSMTLR